MGAMLDGSTANRQTNIRTVTATSNIDLATDDIVLVDIPDTNNAAAAIIIPAVGAAGHNRPLTIKRIDPNPTGYVYVQSAQGIDGDDIHVALSVMTHFGAASGESVTLIWDGTTWRIV